LIDINGVDFDVNTGNSNTKLSWAAANGHEAVVKLMLDANGVDFNVKNGNGNTPLSLAA
jgi:ankyrin repeat protein